MADELEAVIHLSECRLFADLRFEFLATITKTSHKNLQQQLWAGGTQRNRRTGDCSVHLSLNELVWAGHRYSKMIDPELKKR